MASIAYRTHFVTLDLDLPSSVLDAEGERLLAAFHDFGEQVTAKVGEADEARDKPAEEERQITAAATSGRPAPKTSPVSYWLARAEALDREAALLARQQKAAGDAYEAHVRTSPAIAEALSAAIVTAHAEAVENAEKAVASSARVRALAATARSLAAARALADAGPGATQAVHDAFRAAHSGDLAHNESRRLADATTTLLSAAHDFPVDVYAVTDVALLAEDGRKAQAAEALQPKGVETEAARRRRLLLAAGTATATRPRPAQKTVGQMTAEEIKDVADARRASAMSAD